MNTAAWLRSTLRWFFSLLLIAILTLQVGLPSGVQAQDTTGNLKPQDKLSFRLDILAHSPALQTQGFAAQAKSIGLPEQGAASLLRNAQGQILVNVRMSDLSDGQLQKLRAAGATLQTVSSRYRVVSAYVAAADLTAIADLPAVENVTEELAPYIQDSQDSGLSAPLAGAQDYQCPQGLQVSAGDAQLKADVARSTYGLDGSGVTVGILSDSYDKSQSVDSSASMDVDSGDLPGANNPCGYTTPVAVLTDFNNKNEDRGRALMQIIHDLAPGAKLSFSTSDLGLDSFIEDIKTLRASGADILMDNVYYFEEPFFQDGPVNVAISDVVNSGAIYFTAAGNINLTLNGDPISSYEAPSFRPTTCPTGLKDSAGKPYELTGKCHDFDPTRGTSNSNWVTLGPNGFICLDLQWAQPWYGVSDDFDVYLLDASNNIVASSNYINTGSSGTQNPFEFIYYLNNTSSSNTYRIVIYHASGSGAPRLKYIFTPGGGDANITGMQFHTSVNGDIIGPASISGHNASHSALNVAAVPYDNSNRAEDFNSSGPAVHYFGPVTGTTPAAAISPDIIQKPDFAATDGGCNTFYGSYQNGCNRQYGTGAAAAHAAGVAALLKQKANLLDKTFDQSVAKSVLQSTASLPVCAHDVNQVGSGLINTLAAIEKLTGTDASTSLLAAHFNLSAGSNFIYLPMIISCPLN